MITLMCIAFSVHGREIATQLILWITVVGSLILILLGIRAIRWVYNDGGKHYICRICRETTKKLKWVEKKANLADLLWIQGRMLIFSIVIITGLFFTPKVSAYYDAEDMKVFMMPLDSRYEWVEEITKLRGYGPWEGERFDCEGNPQQFGNCAISSNIPINPYLKTKTRVVIWTFKLGFISGVHEVNDVTAPWKQNMLDLYVSTKLVALRISGRVVVWIIKY